MIESLDNKKVKAWSKLNLKKYRNDNYLIINEFLVVEAFKTGYLDTLIYCGNKPFEFNNSYEVSKEVLSKISKTEGLNYIGIGKKINYSNNYGKRVIILEDLSDPLNIGRIIDSAYLFGFDSVILSNNCADIYHQKCLVNSKGNIYHININICDIENEIIELKQNGFKVIATGLRDNNYSLKTLSKENKMAFILGNEGSGVKEETMNLADGVLKIDMNNIDSLNVAMAGAIVMYNYSNIEQ